MLDASASSLRSPGCTAGRGPFASAPGQRTISVDLGLEGPSERTSAVVVNLLSAQELERACPTAAPGTCLLWVNPGATPTNLGLAVRLGCTFAHFDLGMVVTLSPPAPSEAMPMRLNNDERRRLANMASSFIPQLKTFVKSVVCSTFFSEGGNDPIDDASAIRVRPSRADEPGMFVVHRRDGGPSDPVPVMIITCDALQQTVSGYAQGPGRPSRSRVLFVQPRRPALTGNDAWAGQLRAWGVRRTPAPSMKPTRSQVDLADDLLERISLLPDRIDLQSEWSAHVPEATWRQRGSIYVLGRILERQTRCDPRSESMHSALVRLAESDPTACSDAIDFVLARLARPACPCSVPLRRLLYHLVATTTSGAMIACTGQRMSRLWTALHRAALSAYEPEMAAFSKLGGSGHDPAPAGAVGELTGDEGMADDDEPWAAPGTANAVSSLGEAAGRVIILRDAAALVRHLRDFRRDAIANRTLAPISSRALWRRWGAGGEPQRPVRSGGDDPGSTALRYVLQSAYHLLQGLGSGQACPLSSDFFCDLALCLDRDRALLVGLLARLRSDTAPAAVSSSRVADVIGVVIRRIRALVRDERDDNQLNALLALLADVVEALPGAYPDAAECLAGLPIGRFARASGPAWASTVRAWASIVRHDRTGRVDDTICVHVVPRVLRYASRAADDGLLVVLDLVAALASAIPRFTHTPERVSSIVAALKDAFLGRLPHWVRSVPDDDMVGRLTVTFSAVARAVPIGEDGPWARHSVEVLFGALLAAYCRPTPAWRRAALLAGALRSLANSGSAHAWDALHDLAVADFLVGEIRLEAQPPDSVLTVAILGALLSRQGGGADTQQRRRRRDSRSHSAMIGDTFSMPPTSPSVPHRATAAAAHKRSHSFTTSDDLSPLPGQPSTSSSSPRVTTIARLRLNSIPNAASAEPSLGQPSSSSRPSSRHGAPVRSPSEHRVVDVATFVLSTTASFDDDDDDDAVCGPDSMDGRRNSLSSLVLQPVQALRRASAAALNAVQRRLSASSSLVGDARCSPPTSPKQQSVTDVGNSRATRVVVISESTTEDASSTGSRSATSATTATTPACRSWRRLRAVYADPVLHVALLRLLLRLLLDRNGLALNPAVATRTRRPGASGDIPYAVVLHLNHPTNRVVAARLVDAEDQGDAPTRRLARLLVHRDPPTIVASQGARRAKGRFGTLYDCTPRLDAGADQALVVKRVDLPGPDDEYDPLADVLAEVSCLDAFRHAPGVVDLVDYGVGPSGYALVLRAYPFSLRQWRLRHDAVIRADLARSGAAGFWFRDLLDVFAAVVDAVGEVHDGACVHFDLKCDNVLIGDDGRPFDVVLADFGESVQWDATLGEAPGSTVVGRGTENNQSPEMLRLNSAAAARRPSVDPATSKSDIWSLGCLLFELLTGAYLFENRAGRPIFFQVCDPSQAVVPGDRHDLLVALFGGALAGRLERLLTRILVRDERDRPGIHAVGRILDRFRAEVRHDPPGVPSRPRRAPVQRLRCLPAGRRRRAPSVSVHANDPRVQPSLVPPAAAPGRQAGAVRAASGDAGDGRLATIFDCVREGHPDRAPGLATPAVVRITPNVLIVADADLTARHLPGLAHLRHDRIVHCGSRTSATRPVGDGPFVVIGGAYAGRLHAMATGDRRLTSLVRWIEASVMPVCREVIVGDVAAGQRVVLCGGDCVSPVVVAVVFLVSTYRVTLIEALQIVSRKRCMAGQVLNPSIMRALSSWSAAYRPGRCVRPPPGAIAYACVCSSVVVVLDAAFVIPSPPCDCQVVAACRDCQALDPNGSCVYVCPGGR